MLPDARLGDLLTLCQITKYIYHLFFYGKFENFTYNLFQIHMRFCHCLFYNSINNYPIKPPKSGYNNYNRFMMIGVFFLSVCCMHANEMQYDKGVGSDMTNRVHKPLCTCVTLVSTSITFIQVKTSICLSAPICHTQTMIHACSYIGFIIIFSAESDSDS